MNMRNDFGENFGEIWCERIFKISCFNNWLFNVRNFVYNV